MNLNDTRNAIRRKALPYVQSPAQYVGAEWNMTRKDPRAAALRFCLAFPDTYSIGMSYGGLHLLYEILNNRHDVYAERAFAPWMDMEARLRSNNLPLCSVETGTPLHDFDVVGFSLQYEMGYTNLLNMLDLGGIPVLARERGTDAPIIVAGGNCVVNPEPLADFVDLFVIGEGEERILDLADACIALKREQFRSREDKIRALALRVPNSYAPALYNPEYDSHGAFTALHPKFADVPLTISAARIADFDTAYATRRPIVPFVDIVHDRISVEIMRGCSRGCRFCQAGMTRRPIRARSVENIVRICEEQYAATGYSEISLASLSSSDYPDLTRLAQTVATRFASRKVSITFPSLRVSEQLQDLPAVISEVRKSALTVAPEAGTDRLRRVINKDITEEDLLRGVEAAFRQGWNHVKLYFMCGLPTETDEDIIAIARISEAVSRLRREIGKSPALVTASVAPFVPKPHTPFQWEAMAGVERLREIRNMLFANTRMRSVKIRMHKPERSMLEAVFARGDRRLGAVLMQAWRSGCRLDSWDEVFDSVKWQAAFEAVGVDPSFYALRQRGDDEPLPWSHIDVGVSQDFLRRERERARRAEFTADCRHGVCHVCGIPHCPHKAASDSGRTE